MEKRKTGSRFGDKRLEKRYEKVKGQIVKNMRVTMSSQDAWADQVSYYRFLDNKKVSEKALKECITSHCAEYSGMRETVLLISDTSDIKMDRHVGRIKEEEGLGPVGTGQEIGFFCHPTLAVDGESGGVIGLADIYIWNRDGEVVGKDRKARRKTRTKLALEEKESIRWPERAEEAHRNCKGAGRTIAVQDREGDIYESFCRMIEDGLDFVIRSTYDRKTVESTLMKTIAGFEGKREYTLKIEGGRKRKKREAIMSLSYGRVELTKPRHISGKRYAKTLCLNVVHVKEKRESVPPGEEPVEWRLYTTLAVETAEQALNVIKYYKLRWRIEELFRTLKTEGLNFESSELEKGTSLRKLLITSLVAAVEIMQMKQARDGKTEEAATLVFSEEEIECMKNAMKRIEGKTEKQKNPYKADSLAWAAWLIARLGGWSGYASQRPPGVITFRNGWVRFHSFYDGWRLARECV
jgi:hypothetical protein